MDLKQINIYVIRVHYKVYNTITAINLPGSKVLIVLLLLSLTYPVPGFSTVTKRHRTVHAKL